MKILLEDLARSFHHIREGRREEVVLHHKMAPLYRLVYTSYLTMMNLTQGGRELGSFY